MKKNSDNPMDWLNGPPKSEDEQWQFGQRCEQIKVTESILGSLLMGHDKTLLPDNELVDRAIEMAARIVKNADGRFPRC